MSAERATLRPLVIVVGGFLGAGKTSLALAAAQILSQRGLRCAAILNDQSENLVDTHHAEMRGVTSGEVTGGCFCCRFSDLISAMEKVRVHIPDVIFAEPVGSCTDIAATVLGPLREEFDSYALAPFTVLVDPARAAALRRVGADPHMSFLFQNQLQEADLICLTKSDLYPNAELPGYPFRRLSAKTGQGIQEWLNEIMCSRAEPGMRILQIDYEQYARAEGALAWLNLSLNFEPAIPLTPASVAGPLVDHLNDALTAEGIVIVHLKLLDCTAGGWLKVAMCANGQEPAVEGALDASPAGRHELLLNLRAVGVPACVREVVEEQIRCLAGRVEQSQLECFSPAAPKPERRLGDSF